MGNTSLTRRELIQVLGVGVLSAPFSGLAETLGPTRRGWVKYENNPVLGGQYGTCFDICVLYERGIYRMWVSWRPKKSIAITESRDGIHWNAPEIVLPPEPSTGWEDDINRPIVVRRDDGYHMWYTGQAKESSKIGYARSQDGRSWVRQSKAPVLEPSAAWEKVAVMCPHVLWDQSAKVWKMWYSAGDQYEPNAIGYATSADGLHWQRPYSEAVFKPDRRHPWEQERVTAAQVLHRSGWYYAFYIGFRDIDHAQIGLARSRDGISNWERHADNPVVRPTPDGWDADACYKPFAVHVKGVWRLWYNGRREHLEQIGLVVHQGEDLGFVAGS